MVPLRHVQYVTLILAPGTFPPINLNYPQTPDYLVQEIKFALDSEIPIIVIFVDGANYDQVRNTEWIPLDVRTELVRQQYVHYNSNQTATVLSKAIVPRIQHILNIHRL